MKQVLFIAVAIILGGCGHDRPTPAELISGSAAPAVLRDLPPQVSSFIAQKEQDALTLARNLGVQADAKTIRYFHHARKGEYRAASRIYQDLRERAGKVESSRYDPSLLLPLWDPLLDVQLTLDAYAAGAGRFATAFGQRVVQSIPPGSIYFGGTDSGRSLPAVFCSAHAAGIPFFSLTQNHLTERLHLNYLRATFGDKIAIPTDDDSQQAFHEYLEDAKQRYAHDQRFPGEPRQLKPGEDVTMVDGKPHVRGQVAVMALNGLLAKTIFVKNPDREFYVEASFPLDWMYPHLTPHGLIMKINRRPLPEIPAETVGRDREFWKDVLTEFIGDALPMEISSKEVCNSVENVYLWKDFSHFTGDREFVRNAYATALYSKLRSSQADLYRWRLVNSHAPEEERRMAEEAGLAFRQSFALCPTNPEAVFGYVNLLLRVGRNDDARLIAHTAARLNPDSSQFKNLIKQLEGLKTTRGESGGPGR